MPLRYVACQVRDAHAPQPLVLSDKVFNLRQPSPRHQLRRKQQEKFTGDLSLADDVFELSEVFIGGLDQTTMDSRRGRKDPHRRIR
jgi:hypothetical protein